MEKIKEWKTKEKSTSFLGGPGMVGDTKTKDEKISQSSNKYN